MIIFPMGFKLDVGTRAAFSEWHTTTICDAILEKNLNKMNGNTTKDKRLEPGPPH